MYSRYVILGIIIIIIAVVFIVSLFDLYRFRSPTKICALFVILFTILICSVYQHNSDKLFKANTYPVYDNLSKIQEEVDTGDLIFFSGLRMSGIIHAYLVGSSWTHLGMIYKDEKGKAWIIHCSPDGSMGVPGDGVTINPLKTVLDNRKYYSFGVRKLKGVNRDEEFRRKLHEVYESNNHYKFSGKIKMLGTVMPFVKYGLQHSRKKLEQDGMFCSEYMVYLYQKMGLFPSNMRTDIFSPADLVKDQPLIKNYELGKLRLLHRG